MRHRLTFVLALAALVVLSSVPAFASNVCPVTGGPDHPTIKSTPAEVPDKSGNPAHGEQDASGAPVEPQPGDAFWN